MENQFGIRAVSHLGSIKYDLLKRSSLSCEGDLKGLRSMVRRGRARSRATAQPSSTSAAAESAAARSSGGRPLGQRSGPVRSGPAGSLEAVVPELRGRLEGLEVHGPAGPRPPPPPQGSSSSGAPRSANGSQSGEGKGWHAAKGLPGGWLSERRAGAWPPGGAPPADTKLQGSMRCRRGEGRGRGMTLTSSRRALGLQRRGSGSREKTAAGLSSTSSESWQRGRSRTGEHEDIII
ncbi:hypothetical protein CRUP_023447 [Coryphaenoides rupestris]|nr:hypothetical protein CRUP_023447 [Coryphaenoides rupestris]